MVKGKKKRVLQVRKQMTKTVNLEIDTCRNWKGLVVLNAMLGYLVKLLYLCVHLCPTFRASSWHLFTLRLPCTYVAFAGNTEQVRS